MAIFHGLGTKQVNKSAGTLTYRYIKGRTVVSQKRTGSVASKTAARGAGGAQGTYNTRVALFKCFSIFATAHQSAIKAAFNPSKSGNAINTFIRVNYKAGAAAWKTAVSQLYNGTGTVTLADLEAQLTTYVGIPDNPNPPFYRAKRLGYEQVILDAAWSDTIVLQPIDTYQQVVSISTAAATGMWSVSKDLPAVIAGSNISYLIMAKASGSETVTLRIDPTQYKVLDWATLVALGGVSTEEETAGIVNFGSITNGFTGDVVWIVNP